MFSLLMSTLYHSDVGPSIARRARIFHSVKLLHSQMNLFFRSVGTLRARIICLCVAQDFMPCAIDHQARAYKLLFRKLTH